MPAKSAKGQFLDDKPKSRRSGTSPSPARSPRRSAVKQRQEVVSKTQRPLDYTSEGVGDHDIFGLPNSDLTILGVLIALATVIRLFRISQPNSVVFDEVQ